MRDRGGGTDRRAGGSRTGRRGRRPRIDVDTRSVLAVFLVAVTVLSVLAVPVAGAPPDNAKPAGGNGGGNDGGNGGSASPSGSSGDAGGNGNAAEGSSGSDGGGNSASTGSDQSNAGGSSSASSSSGSSGSSGSDGGSSAASSSSGSSGSSGNAASAGSSGNSNSNAGAAGQGGSNGNAASAGSSGNAGNSNAGAAGQGGSNGNAASAGSSGNGNSNAGGNGNGERGPPEQANAGGNGNSNAGGNGNGERGPPEQANAGGNGNGAAVSVSTGRPAEAGSSNGQGPPETAPGQSADRGPSSVVDVSVTGAKSGEKVNIDTATPAAADDAVAFDGISVRVKRDGDFTMRVSNSPEALPGSPAFEPKAAAESLGRIRLDHSITNAEVEDVSYTFRVSKERLRSSGTNTEDVALYRYADGEWTALSTDVVGETPSHYVFEAQSPGMSEFAVGAKRPSFDTYWADLETDSAATGQDVAVSGRVSNVGGADGVYTASLVVDGQVVSTRQVTIAAGGTRQVNFETSFDEAGTHEVAVDGVSAGSVTVGDGSRAADVDPSLAIGFEWALEASRTIRTVGVWSTAGL